VGGQRRGQDKSNQDQPAKVAGEEKYNALYRGAHHLAASDLAAPLLCGVNRERKEPEARDNDRQAGKCRKEFVHTCFRTVKAFKVLVEEGVVERFPRGQLLPTGLKRLNYFLRIAGLIPERH